MVNAVSAGSPSRLMPTAQAARRNGALALKALKLALLQTCWLRLREGAYQGQDDRA